MRIFTNPHTGQLQDLDAVPVSPGGAKFCPLTGQPLNEIAVDQFSYPGPAEDRDTWAADAKKKIAAMEAQANEPNAKTLGVTAPAEKAKK